MRYLLKKKFWSLGTKFFVYDDEGEPVYEIRGKFLSWSDQFSLLDLEGNVLAEIHKRSFQWKPRFGIYRDGELFAEMVQNFTWTKKRYTIEAPNANYVVEGNFWDYQYQVERDDEPIAEIASPFWVWENGYGIETVDEADDILVLCACLIIDRVKTRKREAMRRSSD
ncbi:LURP-one-related family protein [Bremerella sp. JC817]|uniref:LURP-one-related/scramblase family protein n=1 Tax=Bremerella sp. JC817 TaxID=3231756 RepID=UPI003459F68A